jgi:hypothetical protein
MTVAGANSPGLVHKANGTSGGFGTTILASDNLVPNLQRMVSEFTNPVPFTVTKVRPSKIPYDGVIPLPSVRSETTPNV